MTDSPDLDGRVESIFKQRYPGSLMFRVRSNKGRVQTCIMYFKGERPADLIEGAPIKLWGSEKLSKNGKWKNFIVERLELTKELFDVNALVSFMIKKCKGVGVKAANKIAEIFDNDGVKLYKALLDPKFVDIITNSEVPQLARNGLYAIADKRDYNEEFNSEFEIEIMGRAIGLLPASIGYIKNMMNSDELRKMLNRDPYELLLRIPKVPFHRIDFIARQQGKEDSPFRLKALIMHVLGEESRTGGHTYTPFSVVHKKLQDFHNTGAYAGFKYSSDGTTEAIAQLIKEKYLFFEEPDNLYSTEIQNTEFDSGKRLKGLIKHGPAPHKTEEIEEILKDYETKSKIKFDPLQRDAVFMCLTNPVSILTGLPGTGKSTIIEFLVWFLKRKSLYPFLMAPTGLAAKSISNRTNTEAFTIHRGFQYKFGKWGINKKDPLRADVVIIDESSMIDMWVFNAVVNGIQDGTRVIFVGDDEQLPPVDIGTPFADMISTGLIPSIKLDKIFRQDQQSKIITLAHDISKGRDLDLEVSEDLKVMNIQDSKNLLNSIKNLFEAAYEKGLELTVISPMKKGDFGSIVLNRYAAKILNPDGEEFTIAGRTFRIGDRGLIMRNNYSKAIYNGDTCRIIKYSKDGVTVRVDDSLEEITLDKDELYQGDLELGYVLTAHKSQGMEYPVVVFLISKDHDERLRIKNLVYTAITRPRERLILLGDMEVFREAAKDEKIHERRSGLKYKLAEILDNGK